MPNGYESPLNKLADALPNFIMQMQDMKLRQEAQEALTNYRQTMLAQTIRMNDLKQDALRAAEISGAAERNREVREDMLKLETQGEGWANAKYGRGVVAQYYPGGIPVSRKTVEEGRKRVAEAEKGAVAARERIEETVTGIRPDPKAEKTRLITNAKKLFAQKKASVPGTPFEVAIWGERPGWGDEESKELSGILRALKDVHLFEFSPAELDPLNLPAGVLPSPIRTGAVPLKGTAPSVEPTFEPAVAATTGQAISIPDYENPETREKIRWDGSEWAPIE